MFLLAGIRKQFRLLASLTFQGIFIWILRIPISHLGTNVKKIIKNEESSCIEKPSKRPKASNVKFSKNHKIYIVSLRYICMEIGYDERLSASESPYRKASRPQARYERFGEIIRYLTLDERKQFFDSIDNYYHKLMFQTIYELGCRVGEFTRIQVKHLNFNRNTIFFPAENTKTKHPRSSFLQKGLMNEIESMLKQEGIMTKREERIKKPEAYLFHPGRRWNHPYTENRIRQIFQQYIGRSGLQRTYGEDSRGRKLKMFTVHSLRHSHVMHYALDRGVPLPIVQKQVGHRSLKTTSVYLSPSTEKMAEAYKKAVSE